MEDIKQLTDEELIGLSDGQGAPAGSSIQDISDEELLSLSNNSGKNISDVIGTDPSTIAGQAVETAVSPIIEGYRGYLNAVAGASESLSGLAKMVQSASNNMVDTSAIQGLLKSQEDYFRESAESIPETNMNKYLKAVYGMAGSAPVLAAEFAIPMKAASTVGVAGDIGIIAGNAVIEAAKAFNEDQDVVDAVRGGVSGATTVGALSVGSVVASKFAKAGADVLNNFGKKAWASWIAKVTGKESAARDAVANPDKYLKIDDRAIEDITADYAMKRTDLRIARTNAYDDIRASITQRKNDIARKQEEVLSSEQRKNSALLNTERESTKESVDLLRKESELAIKNKKELVDIQTNDLYQGAIDKLVLNEETLGKEIGAIKNELLEISPGVSIDFKRYGDAIEKTIRKMPGIKVVNGKIEPSVKSPEMNELSNRLNLIYDQLRQFRADGEVPLEYAVLMSQKSSPVASLIDWAANTKGMYSTYGEAFQSLKKLTSLKNIKPDGYKTLVNSGAAREKIVELVKKNKEYSSFKDKYEEALSLYTTKMPGPKAGTEVFVPKPKPAIDAIKSNNLTMIKRMKEADKALSPEDRLFPKVLSLRKSIDAFEAETRDSLAQNLKAVRQQQRDLVSKLSLAEDAIRLSNKIESQEVRATLAKSARDIRNRYVSEARKMDNALVAEKDKVVMSKLLNSWSSARMGGLQTGVGLGGVMAAGSGNIPAAAGFGAAYMAMSPKVAFKSSIAAKKAGKALSSAAESVADSATIVRKIIGLGK